MPQLILQQALNNLSRDGDKSVHFKGGRVQGPRIART
jgi:hypothetical protein